MNKKIFLIFSAIILFLIFLYFYFFYSKTIIKEEFSLKLGTPLDNPLSSLIFIADSQGFFKKNNLNVELVAYTTGVDAVAGLLKNEVDLATMPEFVFADNILKGNDLTTTIVTIIILFITIVWLYHLRKKGPAIV